MSKSQERLIHHNGITDSVSGWSRRTGMSKQTIHSRLKRLPKEEALKKTFKERKKRVEISGKIESLGDMVKENISSILSSDLFSKEELDRLKRIKEKREQKWK